MRRILVYLFLKILILFFPAKIHYDTHDFKVNAVQFHTDKIPAGAEFTILQISDLHVKVFDHHNEKLITAIADLRADIIVITGDLIDRGMNNFARVFSLLDHLKAINKQIFFVSGNHEWGNPGYIHFLEGLRERNITILNNQNTQITNHRVTINLAGIDDASTDHENMEAALAGINKKYYTILLSHTPAIKKFKDIPADLILSGHTHGGQVRLPVIGAIIAPGQGLFPKFDKGVFHILENRYLYIDSGLGTSLAPIRFLNKSQLSFIRISNKR